jgi:hypothetical protein
MSDEPLRTMRVSPEERAVILAMRHSEMGGRAIFNYAVRFDDYTELDDSAPPWRQKMKFR